MDSIIGIDFDFERYRDTSCATVEDKAQNEMMNDAFQTEKGDRGVDSPYESTSADFDLDAGRPVSSERDSSIDRGLMVRHKSNSQALLSDDESDVAEPILDPVNEKESLLQYVNERTVQKQSELDVDEEDDDDGDNDSKDQLSQSSYSNDLEDEELEEETLTSDQMDLNRQRTLREMAAYDRIGKMHFPVPQTPFDLIENLQKRKDRLVEWAKSNREPFEKYQDFDSFIDEVTLTSDQGWKDMKIVPNQGQENEPE